MPIGEFVSDPPATNLPVPVVSADGHLSAGQVRAAVAAPQRLVAVETVLAATPVPCAELQSVVALLRETHGALIAGLSLIEPDRQTYVAIDGFDVDFTQVRDELAFCAHVVAGGQPLAVPDALQDERFALTPGVTDRLIAAYVGVPVWIDGQAVGSLCLYGSTPGDFDASVIPALTQHAHLVSMLLRQNQHPENTAKLPPSITGSQPPTRPTPVPAKWSRLLLGLTTRSRTRGGGDAPSPPLR